MPLSWQPGGSRLGSAFQDSNHNNKFEQKIPFQPFDKPQTEDWNVRKPDHKTSRPDHDGVPNHKANGFVRNADDELIGLFIDEMVINFSMSGTVAQSQRLQQFFPHNFNQPSILVSGQCPNSYEFGRLGEFVRESHLLAIADTLDDFNKFSRQIRLVMADKSKVLPNDPTDQAFGTDPNDSKALPGGVKGHFSHVDVLGYIKNFKRGAERWLVAYPWQFEFVVFRINDLLKLPGDSDPFNPTNDLGTTEIPDNQTILQEIFKLRGETNQIASSAAADIDSKYQQAIKGTIDWLNTPEQGFILPSGGGSTGGGSGTPTSVSSTQQQVVDVLLGECKRLHAPEICWVAIIYAAIGESQIGQSASTYTPNSAGYYGVLQGSSRTWPDPHDTSGMADSFLLGGRGFQSGGAIHLANSGVTNPEEIAVRVEVPSIWPANAYAQESGSSSFLPTAQHIVAAYKKAHP